MRKQTKISMPRIEVEDRDRTLSDGWCQANATAGTLVGVLVTNAGFTSTLAEANPSGVKAFSKGAMPTTQTFTSPLLDPVVRIRLPWFGTHAIFVTHELPALKRPMKNPRPFLKKTSSLGHSGESSTREGGAGELPEYISKPPGLRETPECHDASLAANSQDRKRVSALKLDTLVFPRCFLSTLQVNGHPRRPGDRCTFKLVPTFCPS